MHLFNLRNRSSQHDFTCNMGSAPYIVSNAAQLLCGPTQIDDNSNGKFGTVCSCPSGSMCAGKRCSFNEVLRGGAIVKQSESRAPRPATTYRLFACPDCRCERQPSHPSTPCINASMHQHNPTSIATSSSVTTVIRNCPLNHEIIILCCVT